MVPTALRIVQVTCDAFPPSSPEPRSRCNSHLRSSQLFLCRHVPDGCSRKALSAYLWTCMYLWDDYVIPLTPSVRLETPKSELELNVLFIGIRGLEDSIDPILESWYNQRGSETSGNLRVEAWPLASAFLSDQLHIFYVLTGWFIYGAWVEPSLL
jgi:hypothetical protein